MAEPSYFAGMFDQPPEDLQFDDVFTKSNLHTFAYAIPNPYMPDEWEEYHTTHPSMNDGTYDRPPSFLPELPHIMPYQWHLEHWARRDREQQECSDREHIAFVNNKLQVLTPQASMDGLFFEDRSMRKRAQRLVNDGHKIVSISKPRYLGKNVWKLDMTTLSPSSREPTQETWTEIRKTSWLGA